MNVKADPAEQEQEVAAPVLEKPNMDEQSAAPKEEVVEPEPKPETVEGEAAKPVVVEEAKVEEEAPVEEISEDVIPKWVNRELGQKQKQIREAKEQLAAKDQEIEDLRRLAAKPKDGETAPEPTVKRYTEADVKAEAARLRAEEQYGEQLVTTNTQGEKAFGKNWERALTNLAAFGEVPVGTMQGIMATDAPHKVLYELGKNPDEYQRIMDLPPLKRQSEFVKLSLKQDAPKPKPSAAPDPVEPLRGKAAPTSLDDKLLDDSLSPDEWNAAWEAREAEKFRKRA